jgi:hypothetical protein
MVFDADVAQISPVSLPREFNSWRIRSLITAVEIDRDGSLVCTGDMDGLLTFNRNFTSMQVGGHEGSVTAVASSPDGKWLLTGSADETARLWDLAHLHAEPWILHAGPWILGDKVAPALPARVFTPDGQKIVGVDSQGTGWVAEVNNTTTVNSAEAEWRGFVNLWWAFFRDKEVTIRELYELTMEGDVLTGVMGDGRDMSQRTKLGLALGNREGQVWGGKKIVIPRDESGRRRVHRLGGVLYHLIDIGDDSTGPGASTRTESPQSDAETEQQTPNPDTTIPPVTPSMNGQRFRIGDWVQTTLVPEAIRVLAWGNNPDEYVFGFMDQREFSIPIGDREFRISNRPRVKVQTAEILGVAEMP